MKKHDIALALGLFLLPIGQPIYLRTASIFTSPDAIYSLSAKAETKNAQFYYERGVKKSDEGIYKGAISDYNKAIEINPDYEDAYYERGFAKESIKDYKGAISDYTKVIKLNQDAWNAYYGRGYSQWQLGNNKAALSDFDKAIEINPEDGNIYLDRSSLRIEIEDYKGAVSDNNRALKIFSKEKIKLSIEDILSPQILKGKEIKYRAYKKFGRFKDETYTKPITYYIHDKTSRKTLEISDDEEKFIVDFLNYIDQYIDLDFERVDSKNEAIIRISKNTLGGGNMSEPETLQQFFLDLTWSESELVYPKMKNYPTLSLDTAQLIAHEIGHALGLEHYDEGSKDISYSNIDPFDLRINSSHTVMSYNNFLFPNTNLKRIYTELDFKALKRVWGVEKNN